MWCDAAAHHIIPEHSITPLWEHQNSHIVFFLKSLMLEVFRNIFLIGN
jgi:hypothetical protein